MRVPEQINCFRVRKYVVFVDSFCVCLQKKKEKEKTAVTTTTKQNSLENSFEMEIAILSIFDNH